MRSGYLRHPLLRQASALRAQLPGYLRYSLDIEEGSGLEPEEVPDAYGISDRQYEESRKKMDTITHEKTPDTHSAIVGGSSASRILGCPGSVDLLAKIPEAVLNESSSYADEGTGLHEIMAYLVENDVDINTIMSDPKVDELWAKYDLHLDRMYDAVVPAYKSFLAYLDALYESDDDEVRIRVESRVAMPGIEGAFGTCDVLIRAPKKTVVWDWKFGQGVPVLASYKVTPFEGSGIQSEPVEYGNDQLMFYARAAMFSYPDYFLEEGAEAIAQRRPVELVICQPRILDEELSTFEVQVAYLEDFRLDLIDAVEEAQSGKGQLKKGSYCRFAKCKTICPLHLNGAEAMAHVGSQLAKLQLRQSQPMTLSTGITVEHEPQPTAYAEALSAMLDLAEVLEPYINEARAQAHSFMEAGGTVANWKLVPKRAGWDSWLERDEVDSFLSRRKLAVEERRKPWEPITPAVARKLLKSKGDDKGVKLLEKYVKPGVSSGTTIAPADDAREAVQATATMVAELANKIASL
jgi:hypothetical protein